MASSRRACASAVLFVLVALGGTGCGGTDFSARPTSRPAAPPTTAARSFVRNPALRVKLLRSVRRTIAAGSARTSISVTVTGLGTDALTTGAFDVAGTGVVDFGTGNADLSLSIPLFDKLGGGGAVEQRIVDGVAYVKVPADLLRISGLPRSVRWLSFDPGSAGRHDPTALSQSQANPAGLLAFLSAASADVRRVGSEPVRGVATTHYAATIDLAPRARDPRPVAEVRARLAALGAAIGTRRLAIGVWLDRDGRARRMVISVRLSRGAGSALNGAAGSGATMRLQSDFYAFGAAAQIVAPPKSRVRPYSALRVGATAG